MKLNHLDLPTPDVQALAGFLVDHFDLARRTNDRSPAVCILHDDDGFTLVLQREPAPSYPDRFHVGFLHAGPEPVRAHHARLSAAGIAVSPLQQDNRGLRFYLRGPGELLIEVSSRG